jgi:hypothetical protein
MVLGGVRIDNGLYFKLFFLGKSCINRMESNELHPFSVVPFFPNTAYSEKIENRRENICFYEF